ncbi:unnamed protein product [Symbiodinium sp. CCMP2592]|nr:unnamed protein product [Symbiodinium sp. CCMP2592]
MDRRSSIADRATMDNPHAVSCSVQRLLMLTVCEQTRKEPGDMQSQASRCKSDRRHGQFSLGKLLAVCTRNSPHLLLGGPGGESRCSPDGRQLRAPTANSKLQDVDSRETMSGDRLEPTLLLHTIITITGFASIPFTVQQVTLGPRWHGHCFGSLLLQLQG